MAFVIEKVDEYKGYKYAVVFNAYNGFRCGYVLLHGDEGITEEDWGKAYDIICNGGITFVGSRENVNLEKGTWIGFDCGHCFNGIDEASWYEYMGKDYVEERLDKYNVGWGMTGLPVLSIQVEDDCKNIISQLLGQGAVSQYPFE